MLQRARHPRRGESSCNRGEEVPTRRLRAASRYVHPPLPCTPFPTTRLTFSTQPSILSLLLSLSIPTLPLFAILILFGAPLTSHHQHTLLLASHISVLACQPLFFIHGVSARIWQEVLSAAVPFDVVWGGSIGCVVGAWIGAVPIPLDWDREWQKWPVTIVVGAYVGFVVGRYAGEYLLKGRRIEMGVAEEAGD